MPPDLPAPAFEVVVVVAAVADVVPAPEPVELVRAAEEPQAQSTTAAAPMSSRRRTSAA